METISGLVEKTFDFLNEAIQAFEVFLEDTGSSISTQYYKGRDALKQSENLFREVCKKARKFLGTPPDYVAPEFIQYREKLLSEEHILAHSEKKEEISQELVQDSHLLKYMSEDEIRSYSDKTYEKQKNGKRELKNIKARIIIDKLEDIIQSTKELQRKALKKLQNQPY